MRGITFVWCCFILLLSCKPPQNPPKKPTLVKLDKEVSPLYSKDTILYWFYNGYIVENNAEVMELSKVLERYEINKGQLYDVKNKNILNGVHISFKRNERQSEDVQILNGVPSGVYYNSNGVLKDWKTFNYDAKGNLDGENTTADYTTTYNNGSGYWKDFYFKNLENYSNVNFILKEEGEVTTNFKVGNWQYYNRKGVLEKTMNYKLIDSIDVRFPHCLFNKKEPCF